ncbi:MAG TPA: flavin reductase family protein [Anaerolineales bacterium]|nr:flavin reductase family protein [Anaerolineales bacterium]HLF03425.1 flavin reductase family protein [Anaerolineales bacterium]
MDAAAKKTVLRLFTYGLFAVTAKDGAGAHGMLANWITQIAFEPPMLALAVEHDSHMRTLIDMHGAFVVNVLESGQRELAGQLGKTFAKHPDKFKDLSWKPGPVTGSPIMEAGLGWVECRVTEEMTTGDHILYIAEVAEAGVNREGAPLTLKETGFKYFG